MAARELRRVRLWPDHNKVVPRDLGTFDPMPFGDKPILRLRVMHQN
jgi:hypothetical protein